MPSDLSPSEKEERQVERLINKEPAPSRKPAERRGPKHDNRRDRIDVDDPDMSSDDKDMSLNYKSSSLSELLAIAARVAMPREFQKHSPSREKKDRLDRQVRDRDDSEKKAPRDPAKAEAEKAKKVVEDLGADLGRASSAVEKAAVEYGKSLAGRPLSEVERWADSERQKFQKYSRAALRGTAGAIIGKIADLWPRDAEAFGQRAGVIKAVLSTMDRVGLPKSFANVFKRDPGSVVKDKQLVLEIIEEAGRGSTSPASRPR